MCVCVCVCAGEIHGVQRSATGGEKEKVHGGPARRPLCHCEPCLLILTPHSLSVSLCRPSLPLALTSTFSSVEMLCKMRSHPTAGRPKMPLTLIESLARSEVKSCPTHFSASNLHTPQAHLCSAIIFNGVCVTWIGCMDLETLTGKARLAFNEEMAKVCGNIC